ncbi:hypothetical protein EV421DRAFT_1737195 [Armillaria borealis]|uniref:Zn(2)-C6 fungal-type domain-containing protein n=1 Tax=Armillaria borealis TaxID=47425 RepID=A0AA39JFS6_9AGAR|nr:hypothetical protein EV421DRAFT_1737195 [Armillaria borealis]
MSSLTPSSCDANVGLVQPFQDGYDLWYPQSVNFYDYRQHQEPTQPVNDQHPMESNQQQESYDSYDQTTSNMCRNHLPPSSAQLSMRQPQKTPPNRMMHVLTRDRDGKSNRNGDKVFRCRPGVKMKCDFAPGEQTCQRCQPKGYHCVVEAPQPKVHERERLLAEIRQKDAVIETLMKQLHNPYLATPHSIDEYFKSISPSDANDPGVLARLGRLKAGVQMGMGGSTEEAREEGSGVDCRSTNNTAHLPIEKYRSTKRCQLRLAILRTFLSCSDQTGGLKVRRERKGNMKLFSAMLPARHGKILQNLVHFIVVTFLARFKLGNSKGLNSPEILVLRIVTLEDAEQLFDIIYPIAMHFVKYSAANALVQDEMKSVELCQAYILMSIYAVPERSWDRDQTWLHTGLAVSIANALHLDQTPKINSATEIRFHEEVSLRQSGLINSERGNLWDVTMRYDGEIEIFKEEWKRKFKAGGAHRGAMLLAQQATLCFKYAKSVIRCMNKDLAPSRFMRYAPDHHFMCAAFAVVFLFKLLWCEFSSLLDKVDKDKSVKLIEILINKFSSSDIAVDDRHTPKLYARFLATALGNYQQSQGTAPGSSQTVQAVNTGASRSVAGETDKENSDNWRKSYVAQGYDSAGLTYWPEATHAMGSWPILFGSDAALLHIMDRSQNIDGNGGAGGQPGNIEDEMITSFQSLDNPKWLQGMLMPGVQHKTQVQRRRYIPLMWGYAAVLLPQPLLHLVLRDILVI